MPSVAGGDIIARMLAAEGVETVFGIIDGTYFGLYSALPEHGIRLVSPRHETSALHMAGTYARRTGKLGVAIASNGPGVANALPGVAVENGEGNRVLLITSSRRTGISYPERIGAFQSFDQTAVTRPMAKWVAAVPSRERIPELMRNAFRRSWSGRPGVVHVDVPEDIINGKSRFDLAEIRAPATYRRVTPTEPDPEAVRLAASMIKRARTPLIHAGTGVVHSGAFDELTALAELVGAPVTTSWGARGSLPEIHPLAVPMIYLDTNQRLHNDADLVLVLGSRLGETDWWGKAPYWARSQQVIQVDIDEGVLGANKPISLGINADVGRFLRRVVDELAAGDGLGRQTDTWSEQIAAERAKLDKRIGEADQGVSPAAVPTICQQVLGDDTIWVLDGGNTAVWAHFYTEARTPNSIIATFKLGMLGAGVAQALGASVADPGRLVCCLIGDGAMGFHPQEIETAVRNQLPVIFVVFADLAWGMVKIGQHFATRPLKTLVRKQLPESETINTQFSEVRFDELARAMGAHGERVSEAGQLAPALERGLASGLPVVIHVDVDPVAHLWAPALKAFRDMHQEPAG